MRRYNKFFLIYMLISWVCLAYGMTNEQRAIMSLNKAVGLQEKVATTCQKIALSIPGISSYVPAQDVPEKVRLFVQNEFKQVGLSCPENIRIKIIKECNVGVSHNTLCLPPAWVHYLNNDLQKIEDPTISPEERTAVLKKIHLAKAVIQHEAGHIKYGHLFKQQMLLVSQLCLPALLIFKYCNNWTGVTLNCMNVALAWYLSLYYSRTCEQQADENIQNDPHLLEPMVHEFQSMANTCPHCTSDTFADHPAPAKRAARFKARLAQL